MQGNTCESYNHEGSIFAKGGKEVGCHPFLGVCPPLIHLPPCKTAGRECTHMHTICELWWPWVNNVTQNMANLKHTVIRPLLRKAVVRIRMRRDQWNYRTMIQVLTHLKLKVAMIAALQQSSEQWFSTRQLLKHRSVGFEYPGTREGMTIPRTSCEEM